MKQIAVVAPSAPGKLADLAQVLADAGVNIETIDAEAVGEKGVIVLTVDKYDVALRALYQAGYMAVSEDALLIRLPDTPGALANVMARFKSASLNVRSVRFLRRENGFAVVAIGVERTKEALALVEDVLVA
jgi:hypothetical protein